MGDGGRGRMESKGERDGAELGRITASSILKMDGENVTLEREPLRSFFMRQQQQQGGSGWV